MSRGFLNLGLARWLTCARGAMLMLFWTALVWTQSPILVLAEDAQTDAPTTGRAGTGSKQEAASSSAAAPPKEGASQFFFDAAQPGFNRDLNRVTLEGDVVAIGAGTVLSADHAMVDRSSGVLEAKGHVIVLSRDVIFLGEEVNYNMNSGDFRITEATMLANDSEAIEQVTNRILGFTPKELAFERTRQSQLEDIKQHMQRIRDEARRQAGLGQPISEDLVTRYARLLEQNELIARQENPSLRRLPVDVRERVKQRRAYWQAARQSQVGVKKKAAERNAYFKMVGGVLSRTNGNDYVAENAAFTPCLCDEDEAPAWGFRADRIEAQLGGYADLHHPVLEIKGVPVLYLPHLILPIKDTRQSGFLMPNLTFEKRSGNIYSQPVFFDFGDDSDATFTTDVFENRGTRLGVEYRLQQRQNTGWELNIEGMRDRLWMSDRALRDDVTGLYRQGLTTAFNAGTSSAEALPGNVPYDEFLTAVSDARYWEQYLGEPLDLQNYERASSEIDRYLAQPSNTWRGSYSWRGVTFFAPRLSLQSNAEINSDHRYTEELYVPDDFQDLIFGGQSSKAMSLAKAQVHLDARDFYAGLGTRYGDNYQLNQRFEGQQTPLRFKLQSRKYSLLPDRISQALVPVYGQVTGENIRITEFEDSQTVAATDAPKLGDGNWRRLKLDTVSPLITDAAIQVSHFAEAEARFIEHGGLSEPRSSMRSWMTGIELRLPLDGKGELPAWLVSEDNVVCDRLSPEFDEDACKALEAQAAPSAPRFIHHLMDWRLRFAFRPEIYKQGPYTRNGDEAKLAYFATDRFVSSKAYAEIDYAVPEEERFKPYRRVSLISDHVWKLFKRDWQRVEAKAKRKLSDATEATGLDFKERARRELLYSLDRPVTSAEDLYDATNKQWLVDRYQLTDSYYDTPVRLKAQIGYDFLEAEERPRQRRLQRDLAAQGRKREAQRIALSEPWDDLTTEASISHAGFSLRSYVRYGIYLRTSRQSSLTLALPKFFETNISLGYTQEKKIDPTRRTFARTRERRLNLATSLIRPVTSYISLSRLDEDDKVPSYTDSVRTAVGFSYDSPSDCWGLQFAREKSYEKEERNATYVLRLSVVFMGNNRFLPDMSPALLRETRGGKVEEEG